MFLLTSTVLLVALFVWYAKRCHDYFKRKNVPFEKPTFLFGNTFKVISGQMNFGESIDIIYKKYKHCKYVGYYKFLNPSIILNDPELVGKILVKDFQHFTDNEVVADENVDYVSAKNLFFLKGNEWKTTKGLLSPMFTSNKIRAVYPMIENVGEKFAKYICNEIDEGRGNCIDGKQLSMKFTTENVASSVFGLEAKTFESKEETEFVKVARDFGDPSYINTFKFMLVFMAPSLNNWLKLKFFSDYSKDYLSGIVMETLKYRKENNIVRNDFLDMIASLKDRSIEYKFDDKDIVAQAAGFFIDGVETSAAAMSYILYELAANQEIQQKLRKLIADTEYEHGGKMTYEALNDMEYLDCIIHETLRKNPIGLVTFKTCTKEYELPPATEGAQSLKVNVGDGFIIPIEGLHHNPDYYPEPDKFIPERFLSTNKNNMVKHTYFGFGEGPRMCLGMRFALMQIKIAIVSIIKQLHIEVNEKTDNPLTIHPGSFFRIPISGFWFRFKKLE